MQIIDSIFYIGVLIMSIVIHEYAHGYVAYRLGDYTAYRLGRLTINPLKHLDLFGSIVLPFLLIISHAGFVIGWAKPVPFNPDNLRKGKNAIAWVAVAGILANIFIAVFLGLLLRFIPSFGISFSSGYQLSAFYKISTIIVYTNLTLAFFNLIPIPPLDGSKILFSFLPYRWRFVENFLEKWGMIVLLFFIIFLWQKFSPLIEFIFSFLTGF